MKVLIFGDSVTQGFFDRKGGWANRLCQDFQDEAVKDLTGERTVGFNLGISGNMASDLLERLDAEAKARAGKKEDTVIIVAVGLNDSALDDNRVRVDEYKFQDNYSKVLDLAGQFANRVICVGLNAVDENLTNPLSYSSSAKSLKNNRINLFEDCIKQLAVRRKLTLVPIHDMFLKRLKAGEKLLADGLHPNDAGHDFIYQQVKKALQAVK